MILDFKTKQKLTRAEQIARLNPEMSRDDIARQMGISPDFIVLELKRKNSLIDWIIFLSICAVTGALIGWGITL